MENRFLDELPDTDISKMTAFDQLTYGDDVEYDSIEHDTWAQPKGEATGFMAGFNRAEKFLAKSTEPEKLTKVEPEGFINSTSKDINETQKNEGFRNTVYKDTLGFDTIGYGHKLTAADKASGKFAKGVTKAQAQELYEQDEKLHTAGLYKNAPWAKKQPEVVQEVLKDMAYNMGPAFIKKWPQFAKQLREGDYKAAANNMLKSSYAKQVKGRAIKNAKKLASL
ncbi:MAG: hypothetical protein DRG30_10205 [Epsilonproteobacteria bacterium]|nr:MAG: hypothetical protein DRG30_10205 [Campylobacterota bacterium]